MKEIKLTVPEIENKLSVRDANSLLQIIEAKKEFDKKFDELKSYILSQMQEKGIKKVSGKGLSFSIRSTGKKYNYKGDDKRFIDIEQREVKKINTKAIDKYINENQELPEGVTQVARKQTLVIKDKND